MKIGDVYYEKHTVVGISKRTGTVSETDVEIVNVLPIDVLDKIRAEIEALIEWHDCPIEYDNGNDAWYCEACNRAIKIIDKYKSESERV